LSSIIAPRSAATLPIVNSDLTFPVGRIFCVGQNYADHVREMGGDPARGTPIFFDKPASCIVQDGATIPYPMATADLHHEIELAVALKSGGRLLAPEETHDLILGYATSLDMTRRDLQGAAKKAGKPWDMGKGFDQSAPCGSLTLMQGEVLEAGSITLDVNGMRRQSGDLNQMIWTVPEILSELSRLVTLEPGDLILTGTPAGVGPVVVGDHLVGSIAGLAPIRITYSAALA
jgi:fumarylpyruvate hydrolase